ncbi:hypothetical protein BS17DRAFT_767602 [Gyrodon lividus]|nr:hypothetical protein BS17DRAFT_767602 [Gyrodon lividus]
MPAEKHKPRTAPTPYNRQPKKSKPKDTPSTSALARSGALIFTQSMLSQKLKEHPELEKHINDNPNALSSKQPWIVTCPDVERVLFLWVKHIEGKGEQLSKSDAKGSYIHCFKALYYKNFCQRAIDLDEASKQEIYKLNILEGMMMAQHAWDQVSSETIKHCWDYTQIQLNAKITSPLDSDAVISALSHADPTAWKAIKEFATTEMLLPDVENQVQDILGTHYNDADWQPAFKAVMDAEGNTGIATVVVEKLAQAAISHTTLKIHIPAH